MKPLICRPDGGFTLMELMVVIVILAVVAALVYPKLPTGSDSALRSSGRSLAATIRYLEDRATATKNAYRMRLNLDRSTIGITKLSPDGTEVAADDALLKRSVLAEGITITDVITGRLGKVATGEVELDFGPLGLSEFVSIHLRSPKGRDLTLQAYPRSGRVRVFDNYSGGTV